MQNVLDRVMNSRLEFNNDNRKAAITEAGYAVVPLKLLKNSMLRRSCC